MLLHLGPSQLLIGGSLLEALKHNNKEYRRSKNRENGKERNLLRKIVISGEVAKHPDGLVEWAVAIVRGEAVLLQEVVAKQTGNLGQGGEKRARR